MHAAGHNCLDGRTGRSVGRAGPRAAAILFLQLMQRHHEGGIAMARVADALLTEGVVKQAAREMITAQTQESGLVTLLLAELEENPPG